MPEFYQFYRQRNLNNIINIFHRIKLDLKLERLKPYQTRLSYFYTKMAVESKINIFFVFVSYGKSVTLKALFGGFFGT